MQEQNVLFMASLWLYAVFVSPADATDLGYAYLILRSMYPVVWAVLGGEKGMPEAGSMLTFPQYAINVFEVLSVVLKLQYTIYSTHSPPPHSRHSHHPHHSPHSLHSPLSPLSTLHSPLTPLTTPSTHTTLTTPHTSLASPHTSHRYDYDLKELFLGYKALGTRRSHYA